MFRRALLLCCALALPPGCSGCQNRPGAPTDPEKVYDVAVHALARDLPTAQSYAGRVVRVRLPAGSYDRAGPELRVCGPVPYAPPLVVFRCRQPPPAAGALVVTGRCQPPARDGYWRSATADFCVTVTDCSAAAAP